MAEVDLEALIAKAEEVQQDKVVFERKWTGKYRVHLYEYNGPNGVCDGTYDECIKQIRAWGVPPKPRQLTFTLDTNYCENVLHDFNANGVYRFNTGGAFERALTEVLAPYQ